VIYSDARGALVVLTIDRPERRNALDHEALDGLAASLAACGDDVRALVLTGAGGHFCAGADLTGLRSAPFVTLAAVDGAALGAGTQLAVACDLRMATPGASFGIPAGRLGLAVDTWTVERLSLLAGPGLARAMLLAAEVVKGDEAHRVGFVQRLGALDDALAWAGEIAALAPLTLRAHKAALEAQPDAQAAFERAWASEDLREGLAAFHDRRRPVFHGR